MKPDASQDLLQRLLCAEHKAAPCARSSPGTGAVPACAQSVPTRNALSDPTACAGERLLLFPGSGCQQQGWTREGKPWPG